MSLKTKLHEELLDEINELHKMDVGTKEYEVGVNGIEKLAKVYTDMDRDHFEREFKADQFEAEQKQKEIENDLKKEQIENDKKQKKTENIIASCGTGLTVFAGVGLALYNTWFEIEHNHPDMGTREIVKNVITGMFHRKR